MITIYGTNVCGYCEKAKLLATFNKIPFEYVNLSNDENLAGKLKDKHGSSVPIIYDNEEYVGGFDEFYKSVKKIAENYS